MKENKYSCMEQKIQSLNGKTNFNDIEAKVALNMHWESIEQGENILGWCH
jgi:hypothetical protein